MVQRAIKAGTEGGRSSGASSSCAAVSSQGKIGNTKRKANMNGSDQLKKKASLMSLCGK